MPIAEHGRCGPRYLRRCGPRYLQGGAGAQIIRFCAHSSAPERLAAEYTAAAWRNHPPADVEAFFAGLELVGPGVTEAQTWRAWLPEPVLRRRHGHVLAGVGRIIQGC
jgi:hypothetical protein